MIKLGVIGYGYWGPNVVRNFHALEYGSVRWICDSRVEALERVHKSYPGVMTTLDANELLNSPEVDAVAIITPVATHFPLAKKALERGKHVFVEKPFTRSVWEAEELIELAEKKHLKIMVDHTFLFTPAVRKIKELIDQDVLGPLYYFDSTRVNLGLFQSDVNVIWDLAPHDLSIMQYLISGKPKAVAAAGEKHVNGKEDVAYITVYFQGNFIAHFNVNWLSPVKVRMTMIGGEKKMLVWNDVEPDEKIKVYDRGVTKTTREGVYENLVNYRMGDVWMPRLDQTEALKLEAKYFLECIVKDENPFNDGRTGLQVVQILEATNKSLIQNGGLVYLD
jgi:predicted dehydrogenase